MLHSSRDFGPLLLRLFVGLRLIYGVVDNLFSSERMHEFAVFLESNGFVFPYLSAIASAYAQFICGLLLSLGWFTRVAGSVMVVNFLVALVGVHASDTVEGMTPALSMCIISLALVFMGGGKYSVDEKLRGERPIQEN